MSGGIFCIAKLSAWKWTQVWASRFQYGDIVSDLCSFIDLYDLISMDSLLKSPEYGVGIIDRFRPACSPWGINRLILNLQDENYTIFDFHPWIKQCEFGYFIYILTTTYIKIL